MTTPEKTERFWPMAEDHVAERFLQAIREEACWLVSDRELTLKQVELVLLSKPVLDRLTFKMTQTMIRAAKRGLELGHAFGKNDAGPPPNMVGEIVRSILVDELKDTYE